jgi:hypothetical protein
MEAKDFTTFKERLSAFPGIESICLHAGSQWPLGKATFKGKAEQEAFPMSVWGGDEKPRQNVRAKYYNCRKKYYCLRTP